MDEADTAIVFIDKNTFEQKRIAPYDDNVVKNAFKRDDLHFFNDAAKLTAYIKEIPMIQKNLLMMGSGNFGGIDLAELTGSIL